MRIEVRWHGRGGQGAVTAAELLASAAIKEGYYAQAFPEFGAERRGAPVRAYTRIDEKFIYEKTPITEPDYIVILDPSLVLTKTIYSGLKEGGVVVANTARSPNEVRKAIGREDVKVYTLDATKIALKHLKAPIVNTAMIGAVVAVLEKGPLKVTLNKVIEAVKDKFGTRVAEVNINAIKEAYEEVSKVVT